MKIKTLVFLTLTLITIRHVDSALSGAGFVDNSLNGLLPPVAFESTSIYQVLSTCVTSLTTLSGTIATTSTQALYNVMGPVVQAVANQNIANYNVMIGGYNAYNSQLSLFKNADDWFKRRYNSTMSALVFRLANPKIPLAYNSILPNITVVEQ